MANIAEDQQQLKLIVLIDIFRISDPDEVTVHRALGRGRDQRRPGATTASRQRRIAFIQDPAHPRFTTPASHSQRNSRIVVAINRHF